MFEHNTEKPSSPTSDKKWLLSSKVKDIKVYSTKEEEEKPALLRMNKVVDVHMVPSKLCFFFYDAAWTTYTYYLVLFLTSIGLTVKEAGVISGCRLLVSSILTPLWGYLIDYTGRRKIIYVVLCLGTALTFFPLPWVAKSLRFNQTNSTIGDRFEITRVQNYRKIFTGPLFYVMLLLVCASTSCLNTMRGVLDSFVMNVVMTSVTAVEYGRQNLFGAVGFGISNIIAGIAVEHYDSVTLSKYTASFYVFLPASLLLIPVGLITASQMNLDINQNDMKSKKKNLHMLVEIIRNIQNIVFMLSVIIVGICHNVITSFLFKLMEDQMEASKLTMGFANLAAGTAEMFVFLYAKPISKLLGGPINSIMASIFSYCIRFILLSFMKNEWLVLPTQLFHGISYALFWVNVIEYTDGIAPDELYTTLFSIIVNLHINCGGVIGTLIGGIIYDGYGGNTLFFGIACLCLIWFVFMAIFFNLKRCKLSQG